MACIILSYSRKDLYDKPGPQTTFESANKITPDKYGHALWMVRELQKIVEEDGGPQNSHEERVMEEATLLLALDHEKIK